MAEFQLRQYWIDGIDVGNHVINWNDRVFFGRHKTFPKNISNANVLIPFQRKNFDGRPVEEWAKDESRHDSTALWYILLFFSCYHLVNNTLQMPKIAKTMMSAIHPVVQKNAAKIYAQSGGIPNIETNRNILSVEKSTKAMKRTLPLFKKVMKIYESKPNNVHSIIIALILYQRAVEEDDHLVSFLHLVMALESLFSDGQGEITYKFSLRTSNFVESQITKRHDLFEKLKIAYRYRSDLVHGDDLSLDRFGKYNEQRYFLLKIVQKTLLKYIPMALSGKSKKQIYKEIDDYSLRVKKKL